MNMAPRRLPSLKAQIIEDYESDMGRRYCMGFMESINIATPPVGSHLEKFYDMPQDGHDLHLRCALAMRAAENYHVSSDIVHLIEQASLTLPLDEAFSNFDVPATNGFIYLDTPLETRDVHFKRVTTRVLVWSQQLGEATSASGVLALPRKKNDPIPPDLVRVRNGIPGINVSLYHMVVDTSDRDDYSDEYESLISAALWGNTFIPYGDTTFTDALIITDKGYVPAHEVGVVTSDRWLRTFWKFVRDEIPAIDITREPPPRSDLRYLRRMRMTDNQTTVITLRKRMPGHSGGAEGREYSHRFIVRGHWAKRWCGPGRTELRYVYINPYLKGPEGAPLLAGREHVHHVAR